MTSRFLPKHFWKLFFLTSILMGLYFISSAQNPIVDENNLPGTAQAIWDAGGNAPIEGFAQEFSVNKGDSVRFKIDVESAVTLESYTVKIYRLGWYNGDGARLIADLGNSLSGNLQDPYNYDTSTGKVDCSNWEISCRWLVPATAVSGVYIARLDCPGLNAKSIILFVVRDDAANSPVLFKTSDATWQAYNLYGGNNFYGAATPVPGFSHATKVSYQRPLHLRGDKSNFFNSEYPMIRWLERNGYNVSYTTDMDMARDASVFTPAIHKTILSVGHDEYWSAEQRTKIETARNNGVNLAFFSANNVYWKTRWEDNYQTLVCYKEGTMGESICGTKCDPLPNVWTGLWRDGCPPVYAPNDGCLPEGSLLGQMSWTQSTGSIKVPDTYKNLRFWKNTSIASLGTGQTAVLPYGTLGNEWDPEQFTETYPAHRVVLSNTLQAGLTHKMSLYKHSSGALVFAAGSMQWAWGLDDSHDLNTATPPLQPVSTDMQQATVNLLHDMGADAGSLQVNLVAPAIGSDAIAPGSIITSPIHNATVAGATVTITGTSSDNGGGAVAGVEVSLDNGTTWNTATGLENWSYTFSSTTYGTITIKVRAWDDLGNVEVPGSPGSANCINISLSGPFIYSVFNSSYPATPPAFFAGIPVELGMKFRSSITGFVTGLRYYKGTGVTGVHTGHLWSNTGTMLAEATFTNETASGWQTVTLATPVAITPNTTYVVSYFTASGDFTKFDPFFTTAVVNGFLRGLANGEDGGNGVYNYSATASFPNNTAGSSNYFADIIFESNDITAPQVLSIIPDNNSTGVALNIHPTATLDETLNPASVTRSSVIMTGPGNIPVSGSVSLTGGGTIITFTPNAELAPSSTYTVTLKGGLTGPVIKDLIGNVLASNYSWSFTTGALSAPTVVTKPSSLSTCANSIVSFTSTAIGIPTPTVQWQKSTNNGLTWADITGATSGTYTFTAVYTDNNNQYRAVWTNNQGHDNSIPAVLTVAEPVSGSIGAVNSIVCPGAPMLLQLTAATGPSPYTLQINSNTYPGITIGQPFRAFEARESIWTPVNTPNEIAVADNNSVELGVKFKTSKDGIIKGIRFYKGSTANGGTHIGSLWSQSGTLLGSATFTNETASGWQEVSFTTPVAVTANTIYIASYFLPLGNYSRTYNYFLNSGYSNGNSLTAPQSIVGELNGVYGYTATSAFPDNSFGNPNYWVDVVFAAYAPTTTTTFNLTSITAANGCAVSGNPVSTATITVGNPADAGTVSGTSTLCIGATAVYATDGSTGGAWSSTNTAVATVDPSTGLVTAVGAGVSDITYTVTGCTGTVNAFQPVNVLANANAGIVSGTSLLCIGATNNYSSNGDAGGLWSSSNPAVATVDANGLVLALIAGTTDITYTVSTGCNNPVSASMTLTVAPNANAGIVSGPTALCIGATADYISNGDANGLWSSSDPAVATVNAAGQVTILTAGTTDIVYTVSAGCNNPVTASATLTVAPDANAGIVSGNSPLCIGATATYNSDGDAGGVWSTSNPAVASVNANGLVTALTAGTTNITYTISAGCNSPVMSYITLTVNQNANAGTVFSGVSTLCIGTIITYSSNGDAGGLWSSSDPAVATVDATGLATALAAGTTNITYTVNTGCNSPVSAYITLTVASNANAGTVSGISPLCIGATATYSSNGNTGGVWSSSDPVVASVNAVGFVTALTAGTTNITYTVNTNCGGPAVSFKTLTVNPNANAGTVSGTSPLCIGATATYTNNGNTGGAWSSSNPAVATVNAAGLVIALTAGTTNIIYTVSTGCNSPATSSKTLTVGSNANAGIVSGNSPICIGATAAYSSNGNTGGTWSSSNPAVATVNAAGLVTAFAAGATNITYTVNTSCSGSVSAFKTLTVSPNANAGTVSGNSPLCKNATATYSSNGNAGGVWSSSNPSVATVNAAGLVTALSTGTTNIKYTVNTGCNSPVSSFKTLTVASGAIAGTVSGTSPLCISATATYTSNGTAGGTWTSSNPVVASVNAAGMVTALTAGTTNITYTVSTGCNSPVSSFKTLTVGSNANAGIINGNSPLCISATATYSSNGNSGGAWSSSNPAIATVNAAGLVTALTAGTTNITYTVSTGCNSPVSSFKTLTVSPNATAGTVSGNSPLCKNATATYSSNGNAGGVWSSSNPAVATVNAAGLVTALSTGTTNIKYTVNTGCNSPVSSFKTLTVGTNTNAGTISGNSPLCIGVITTYSSNGNTGGTWSSSNPAVATVNAATGSVKALAAGTTNIRYTVTTSCSGTVSSFKTLTVSPNANAGTVSGTTPYCSLQMTQFTSNGDPGGTWSSSNPWVAYVTPNGYVIALFFGTANIIYTVNSGCNAPVSSYKSVTISLFPYAGIVSGASPVCAGTSTTYTTNGSTGGIWSSSNTAVATVNAVTGVVNTVSAGSSVITYTVRACIGNASNSKTITVNPATVPNAGTVSGISPLCINATTTYTSNGNSGGTWSSANPSVASVNASTGLVKGLTAGTTNIKYTVVPVCGNPVTSQKAVTINYCNTFANTGGSNTSKSTTPTGDADNSSKQASREKALKIDAYPNPAHSEFTLMLTGYGNDKVTVVVTDLLGKKVYQAEGSMRRQYIFGQHFVKGIYLVQVIQGNSKQSMKLVKE